MPRFGHSWSRRCRTIRRRAKYFSILAPRQFLERVFDLLLQPRRDISPRWRQTLRRELFGQQSKRFDPFASVSMSAMRPIGDTSRPTVLVRDEGVAGSNPATPTSYLIYIT